MECCSGSRVAIARGAVAWLIDALTSKLIGRGLAVSPRTIDGWLTLTDRPIAGQPRHQLLDSTTNWLSTPITPSTRDASVDA